jgi:hypothetical protein
VEVGVENERLGSNITAEGKKEAIQLWEGKSTDSGSSRSSSSSSSSESGEEEGGGGAGGRRVESFRPLPPPRRAMEAVEVEFTKLETDTLPARENRGEAGV